MRLATCSITLDENIIVPAYNLRWANNEQKVKTGAHQRSPIYHPAIKLNLLERSTLQGYLTLSGVSSSRTICMVVGTNLQGKSATSQSSGGYNWKKTSLLSANRNNTYRVANHLLYQTCRGKKLYRSALTRSSQTSMRTTGIGTDWYRDWHGLSTQYLNQKYKKGTLFFHFSLKFEP